MNFLSPGTDGTAGLTVVGGKVAAGLTVVGGNVAAGFTVVGGCVAVVVATGAHASQDGYLGST
jgi:hypothetical protein